MREQTGGSVSAAPATQDVGSGALFIITLSSSTAPMALDVPSLAELAGLAVFRSRKVEDGRDRFRLHLGYFESPGAAEAVLPVVREHFPAAWIGPAPNSGMGSLDDTSVAQFKFIKAPSTIKSDGGTSTRLRALTAGSTPAIPGPASSFAAPAPAQPASRSPVVQRNARADEGAKRAAPPVPSGQTMAPGEVLSLLESTPATPPPSRQAAMQPRERAAVIGAIQRFAVQLVWSTEPVNLIEVPKLAIFDAYTLYKVQVDRAGRRWYGLRLGFFGDPVSARQVSLYARSDFSAAAVVPVSDRECDRAGQAAVKELPQPLPTFKPQVEMELVDVPRSAAPSVMSLLDGKPVPAGRKPAVAAKPAGAPARVSKTPARSAAVAAAVPGKPVASRPAASQPSAAKPRAGTVSGPVHAGPTNAVPPASSKAEVATDKPEKTRRLKSTAEMAAELASEPQFDLDGDTDPLNDTGVRHLAVTVVRKNSGLGKLLKRRSRRS